MKEWIMRCLPVGILVAGGLAAGLVAQGRTPPRERARPPVSSSLRVLEAQPRDVQVTIRAHGSVAPRTEIDLIAEVPGRIIRVSPALVAGGAFESGEVLIELERDDAIAALEKARAALRRIDTETRLASSRLRRLRALAKREIISAAELEKATLQQEAAEARREEARASAEQAERNLERTRIRAPFEGRVRAKHVDLGQFVNRGTPLARLYAVDALEVRLPIQTGDLAFLDLPQAAAHGVASAAGPLVWFEGRFTGRQHRWQGHIVGTEGAIAARSRMLNLIARISGPGQTNAGSGEGPLASPSPPVGLFVEAEIVGRTLENVFVLPRSALQGTSQVLVVDADNRVWAREVEVLRVDADEVIVGSGLAPGSRVAAVAAEVDEGARVRPVTGS